MAAPSPVARWTVQIVVIVVLVVVFVGILPQATGLPLWACTLAGLVVAIGARLALRSWLRGDTGT